MWGQLGRVEDDPRQVAPGLGAPARHSIGFMKTARATITLGDLHRATPWLWLNCERCQHYAPLACAVAVIRWGAGASSDVLGERARCTRCGNKGATIQHPGWGGADVGFLPFPVGRLPGVISRRADVRPTSTWKR
jgi:hypothetical protein